MKNKFVPSNKDINLFYSLIRIFYRIIKFLFKPKKIHIKQIKKLGIKYFVFVNEEVGFRMLFPGLHESNEIKILDNLTRIILKKKKQDIVFIDVGANFGLYSIYFSKLLNDKGYVYAFEPDKNCCNLIERNPLINNAKNILINNCALSDKIGFTKMSNVDDQTALGFVGDVNKEHDELNKIKVTTLDSIFEKEKKEIDIVKIDVEGHEASVINGFKQLLSETKTSPKVMMIELVDVHLSRYGSTSKDELINFICSFGYSSYINYRGKKLVKYLMSHKNIYNIFFIKILFLSEFENLENEKIFK